MPKPLAEIVLEEGLATAAAVERAAAAADRDGTPLVCALVRECGIDQVALVAAMRRHVRVATADPATVAPEPEAVRELQRDVCRRQRVVPLGLSSYGAEGRVLRLAMADPTDAVAIAEVEHVTGCRVDPVLMTVSAVEELVETTYRALVTEVMRRGGEAARHEPVRHEAEPPAEAARGAKTDAVPTSGMDGPVTVPFHKLSDEAGADVQLRALINLLLAKRVVSEDELEDEVRQVLRSRDEDKEGDEGRGIRRGRDGD